MTNLELRSEIHKAIDNMSENVLPEILDYLNNVQKSSSQKDLEKFIDKVFNEDDELLKKLAL